MKSASKKGFRLTIATGLMLTIMISAFFGGSVVNANAKSEFNASQRKTRFIEGALEPLPRQLPDHAGYKEEYYLQQLDGSYLLAKTVEKTGVVGEIVQFAGDGDPIWNEVSAVFPDGNMGFIAEYGHVNTVDARTVTRDGNLVLKMYFERNTFQYIFINHASAQLQKVMVKFGENLVAPEPPIRDGCRFEGWVIEVVGAAPAAECGSAGVPEGSAVLAVNGEVGMGARSERYVAAYAVGAPNPPIDPPVEPVVPVNPGGQGDVVQPASKGSSQAKGRSCQDDGYPQGYVWNGSACVAQGSYQVPNTGVK